jgi:hypothetical protein
LRAVSLGPLCSLIWTTLRLPGHRLILVVQRDDDALEVFATDWSLHSVVRLTNFSQVTDMTKPASIDVAVDAVICRRPDVVAAYASDPSNAPKWYVNISEVVWKTPPPLRVGSEVAFVARFLGRVLRYTYEIVEYTPTSLVMRTAEGPFPMETMYRYEATPEGYTRMTLRNRGTPSGFARLMSPFMRIAMQRANCKDLEALKLRLEE